MRESDEKRTVYPIHTCWRGNRLLNGQLILDFRDRQGRVEALRACSGAVENRVAAVQTHVVLQLLPALLSVGVLQYRNKAWERRFKMGGRNDHHVLVNQPSSGRLP